MYLIKSLKSAKFDSLQGATKFCTLVSIEQSKTLGFRVPFTENVLARVEGLEWNYLENIVKKWSYVFKTYYPANSMA